MLLFLHFVQFSVININIYNIIMKENIYMIQKERYIKQESLTICRTHWPHHHERNTCGQHDRQNQFISNRCH